MFNKILPIFKLKSNTLGSDVINALNTASDLKLDGAMANDCKKKKISHGGID